MAMESLKVVNSWRSLTQTEWVGIPRFVVLSGFNGMGKTQLMTLLSNLGEHPWLAEMASSFITASPKPDRIGYLAVDWRPDTAKVTLKLLELIDHVEKRLDEYKRAGEDQLVWLFEKFATHFGGGKETVELIMKQLEEAGALRPGLRKSEIYRVVDPYLFVSRAPEQPLVSLAELFFCYCNFKAYKASLPDDPPWDHVNQMLSSLQMCFCVEPPDMPGHDYELLCIPTDGGPRLAPKDLSSGEQAALALVATFVTTVHLGRKHRVQPKAPDLLLLDEPDAHLHPSLVKEYLGHLRTLVEQYGTQVIMVTHRPDTLALAPPESLYEMKRDADGKTSIEEVASRTELISRLAADSIAVLPGVRIVLTEAEADQRFHQWAYERALAWRLLPRNPRLEFKAVAKAGGKTQVVARVQAAHADGLQFVYRGLVDRDAGSDRLPPGVCRLERYAIENYFADPLALYASIVNDSDLDDKARLSAEGALPRRDLHKLREMQSADLQPIVDTILRRLDLGGTIGTHEAASSPLVLHGERSTVTLQYPAWLRTMPKARLRNLVRTAFVDDVLSHWDEGPERCDLVPADLVEVYRQLVTTRL